MVALNIETFVVCLIIAFLAGILVTKTKSKNNSNIFTGLATIFSLKLLLKLN